MAKFIAAKDLPVAEGTEVDVLCVEGGVLKRRNGALFTDVYTGNWTEDYNGSGCSGYICFWDAEMTKTMSYAEFKEIAASGLVVLPYTETYDDGSTWNERPILTRYGTTDDFKVAFSYDWDCCLFFSDTELPAAVATMSLDDEGETPVTWTHTPYPPRG